MPAHPKKHIDLARVYSGCLLTSDVFISSWCMNTSTLNFIKTISSRQEDLKLLNDTEIHLVVRMLMTCNHHNNQLFVHAMHSFKGSSPKFGATFVYLPEPYL